MFTDNETKQYGGQCSSYFLSSYIHGHFSFKALLLLCVCGFD